jgi:hypothetical protein
MGTLTGLRAGKMQKPGVRKHRAAAPRRRPEWIEAPGCPPQGRAKAT